MNDLPTGMEVRNWMKMLGIDTQDIADWLNASYRAGISDILVEESDIYNALCRDGIRLVKSDAA